MTDKLKKEVAAHLIAAGIAKHHVVVLAISGGRDSVVLGQILHLLGQSFALAHLNYGLRGDDSIADEAFVGQCAARWGVELYLKRAKEGELDGNIQQSARRLRYSWLEELCESKGFKCYLTAHHQRDQAEGFLLALLKGRGSRALSGMPLLKGRRLRPLLHVSSSRLEVFASEQGLLWRHDHSNDALYYDRNFIRNQILPLLHQRFPLADQLVAREVKRLQMQEDILVVWLQQNKPNWISEIDASFHCWDLSHIKSEPWLEWVIGRLASDYGWPQSAIDSLWKLWHAPIGKKMKSNEWTVVRTARGFDWFVLPEKGVFEMSISAAGIWDLPGGLKLEVSKGPDVHASEFSYGIAIEKGTEALAVRYWRPGDKVQMPGRGLRKVSNLLQEWQWNYRQRFLAVVLTLNDDPVWVVGSRSRTFAQAPTPTQEVLVFTIKHD